jgi:hypothetical protein
LKDFRRWGKEEKSSRVPIAEGRNPKKWSPGFLLRRVKHRLPPVVPLEDLRDLAEANEYRWSAGYNLSLCIHFSITSLDTTNCFANQLATYCRAAGSRWGLQDRVRSLVLMFIKHQKARPQSQSWKKRKSIAINASIFS